VKTLRACALPSLALTLLAALALAGCSNGGSTVPGGYHCTAPQHQYGCYTQIAFAHSHINPDSNPDIPADPVGSQSDLYMVPLTCDPACQASSGGGNPPGYIANFIQLWQQSGGWFMRIGYETTPSGLQFFLQYMLPGVNNGQYANMFLGTPSISSNPSAWHYATMFIGLISPDPLSPDAQWEAFLRPDPQTFTGVGALGQTTFHPDHVFYGQAIYGTSGATAQLSFFANNSIFTSPFTTGHETELLTEDGTPPAVVQTVDNPTDAGWFIKASASSSGGMFRISCC
jgi:hypothetical protein